MENGFGDDKEKIEETDKAIAEILARTKLSLSKLESLKTEEIEELAKKFKASQSAIKEWKKLEKVIMDNTQFKKINRAFKKACRSTKDAIQNRKEKKKDQ